MAGMSGQAIGMAGTIIGLAALAAWLGLAHSCDPATGEPVGETADNLKKSGAFVPGIRPGDQTARYIDKILLRLTFAGAIYITFVCLLPEFLILKYNVPFYFGGTSLLIIVVVTMDFMAQVQNYLMSQQYESLLKKANFKSTGV